ncbi:MAG: haloalkane dehalogenase [Actinomycetota bacterium]
MHVLRTPDDWFADLPDFPYLPHHVEVEDGEGGRLRVAYLDEGERGGETVLLLHGEPSWSFLYRTMIPPLVSVGLRVIVPDLVGFGRSDKPARREDYTYARHVDWMRQALLDGVGLDGVTAVGQDWGGLIGLRLVAENPDRFARVVVANTGLPTGDRPMSEAFLAWQRYSQDTPELRVGRIVAGGCRNPMRPDVVAAYDAPFPDDTYKAGARVFPMLVPTCPDDPAAEANRRAWAVLSAWDKPFLTAFSDADPITGGGDRIFHKLVPGAAGREHVTLAGGGHFLQEDLGPQFAAVIARFVATT